MLEREQKSLSSLVQRLEHLASVLQNSSVGELEFVEGGTAIIIKRRRREEKSVVALEKSAQPIQTKVQTTHEHLETANQGLAIVAPLTGVFYSSPSPGLPPFVKVGDIIQSEQVVALIEAMKVFNEIQARLAGRLTQMVAPSGAIVKKGDVLFRVEPL